MAFFAFHVYDERAHRRPPPPHKEMASHLPAPPALDLHNLAGKVHLFPRIEHELIHGGTPHSRRLCGRPGLISKRTAGGIFCTRGRAGLGSSIVPYV